jgi:hypothetical protein
LASERKLMNRVLLLLMGLLCGVMALGQVRDLGPAIQMTQWIGSDTWSRTLTRRGDSNTYDAVARSNQTGQQSNHVFEVRSFDGKTVTFFRQGAGLRKETGAGSQRLEFPKAGILP